MIKICHLIDTLSPGGAENMVLNLSRELPNDFDIYVFFLEEPNTLRSKFEKLDIEVTQIGKRGLYDPKTILALYKELIDRDFDILHTHLPASTVIGRVVGRLSGIPAIVSTQHNITNAYSYRSMLLERITRPLDSRTVAVSESVRDSMDCSLRDNFEVIYNGVDVREFSQPPNNYLIDKHGIDPEDIVFLNVGRYVQQKSQDQLIEVIDRVIDIEPNVHLFIVGWGPMEAELQSKVEQSGLDEFVTVTGFVECVSDYYRNSDVFISSSQYEGLPVTLLEAMAARLPIVGTNVPGTSEVVIHGSTGDLVSHNSVSEMANSCVNLLNEKQRQKYQKQAYDRVNKKFSIEVTTTKHKNLYYELANK